MHVVQSSVAATATAPQGPQRAPHRRAVASACGPAAASLVDIEPAADRDGDSRGDRRRREGVPERGDGRSDRRHAPGSHRRQRTGRLVADACASRSGAISVGPPRIADGLALRRGLVGRPVATRTRRTRAVSVTDRTDRAAVVDGIERVARAGSLERDARTRSLERDARTRSLERDACAGSLERSAVALGESSWCDACAGSVGRDS